jgi:hypothetical protein
MSGFLTLLNTSAMVELPSGMPLTNRSGRRLFELLGDLAYRAVSGEVYTVKAGFVTDFGSVPRVPIIFDLLGDIAYEPYVLHDMLYSTGIASRKMADLILHEALLEIGIAAWKAKLIYLCVRAFGSSHFNKA